MNNLPIKVGNKNIFKYNICNEKTDKKSKQNKPENYDINFIDNICKSNRNNIHQILVTNKILVIYKHPDKYTNQIFIDML